MAVISTLVETICYVQQQGQSVRFIFRFYTELKIKQKICSGQFQKKSFFLLQYLRYAKIYCLSVCS